MSSVRRELSDGILTVEWSRPEKLNALTTAMYEELRGALEEAATDDAVDVVVVRGAGRSFSSGWDRNEAVPDLAQALRVTNACRWAVWDCPKPVVMVTQGHCLGGAFELVLPADLVITTDDCLFGMPEVRDGASAGFNMLPWLGNHKAAKSTLLLAEMFGADEALRRGIVTHVAPAAEIEGEVDRVLGQLRAVPGATLAQIKRETNAVYEGLGLRTAIDQAVEAHAGTVLFDG